jgi:hypothetical protein
LFTIPTLIEMIISHDDKSPYRYQEQEDAAINTNFSQVPAVMCLSAQLRHFLQLVPFAVLCLESWLKVAVTWKNNIGNVGSVPGREFSNLVQYYI